jgi:site-specific recombinase XerD
MKLIFLIRKKAKSTDFGIQVPVYVRIREGRKIDKWIPTRVMVNPNLWDSKEECIKKRVVCDEKMRQHVDGEVKKLRRFIEDGYEKERNLVDAEWPNNIVDRYYHPEDYIEESIEERHYTLLELFDIFLDKHKLSEVRKKNFRVIKRVLQRYELFLQIKKRNKKFFLDVDTMTSDDLVDMKEFFRTEYQYADEKSEHYKHYKKLFTLVPESREPSPRGENTLVDYFNKIRTFFRWCYDFGYTTNRPFDKFKVGSAVYGTPIYINLDERNKLYAYDFSDNPRLERQRDIFVFQTLIGCRVGDLYRLTKANIVDGSVEYIPDKTIESNPKTLSVPLNSIAQEIIKKYKDIPGDKLFPFVAEQQYNEDIKNILKTAGIDRMVTVLNPLTRKEEQHPIYDVASSHMARRTFIGNLYKKVKDPNLVGALSGHKEGSKAFARYRDIDDEIKKDLVSLLD